MFLRDVFSTPLTPKHYPGINGSPFIFDEWLLASIILFDGRKADSIYVKLNAYSKKVHFKDEKGEELESKLKIIQIAIIDSSSTWLNSVFRTGYTDDYSAFFLVLVDGGKMQLLKRMKVIVWQTKALGEEDKKTFQMDEETFFASNMELYFQDKKCTGIPSIFEQHSKAVREFITSNAINCKKIEDMKKLVSFVNSL